MTILKKVEKITNGAKKHLEGSDKIYGDRLVKTVNLKDGIATTDNEFHRKSFFGKSFHSKEGKPLYEKEQHKVRYVRKGNSIVIVHLDRE